MGFTSPRLRCARGPDEARARFLAPLVAHLETAGLGHVSEIADAEAPHMPRGCPFQAWSIAELIRLEQTVLSNTTAYPERAIQHPTPINL